MPPALRMGKYVIDGLLGPGGVTETYLAHVEADDKPGASVELCALKLLRPDRVPEGSFAEVAARFVSAGRQLRDFHRPGFGRVKDICEDPSATFLVSQHVPGCDLGRLLETCQAEGKQGVHPVLAGLIGSEIARLLHVGHSAKPAFCHLGLCPQNVIVAASGDVTLLDAGIGASLRAITEQPAERWAMVAPELQGVDAGAGHLAERAAIAADLYSLGALLFFLTAGRAPDAPSENGAVVEVPEIPGLTSKLALILRRLLAHKPDDRPEDAATLVEWLGGEAGPAQERRRLISEGVRAAEKGIRVSSPNLPAISSELSQAAPAMGTPSVPAAGRFKPGRRLRAVCGAVLAVLAGVAALWIGVGGGRKQDSHPPSPPAAESPHRSQDVEMPQAPGRAGGGKSGPGALGDEAPANQSASDSLLARVAGHLVVETVPPGAMVWVDGVLKGRTFADIVVGDGGHRVVVIAPGHRMFRDVIDTSRGTFIRRALAEIPPPVRGNGFVDVSCRTVDRYPVLLDDEETGLLCPVKMLPTTSGKHTVGIFVPPERRTLSVETTVAAGSSPARVVFSQ